MIESFRCGPTTLGGRGRPASVAAPVPVPDLLESLDPADRAIAERIRDLLAVKPSRIFADEKEYAAVEAFYQKRNLAPLWLDKGVANATCNGLPALAYLTR